MVTVTFVSARAALKATHSSSSQTRSAQRLAILEKICMAVAPIALALGGALGVPPALDTWAPSGKGSSVTGMRGALLGTAGGRGLLSASAARDPALGVAIAGTLAPSFGFAALFFAALPDAAAFRAAGFFAAGFFAKAFFVAVFAVLAAFFTAPFAFAAAFFADRRPRRSSGFFIAARATSRAGRRPCLPDGSRSAGGVAGPDRHCRRSPPFHPSRPCRP